MNQKKVIKKLIEKAWQDANFKAQFIADPVKIIEQEAGEKINLKGKEIIVLDQSDPNTYYLNLTRYVNSLGLADRELTDEQLEVVAGGAHSEALDPKDCPGSYWREF